MNTHYLAIKFNNLGVALLTRGSHQESMYLFKGATQLVTNSLRHHDEVETSGENILNDSNVIHAHVLYDMHIENMDNMLRTYDEPLTESTAFFCERAILLHEYELPLVETQRERLICSILIYNIALALHLSVRDPTIESSGQKTLQMYEMALTLASKQPDENSATMLVVGRVAMYCLNNMALLNHQVGKWDTSVAYMKRLCTLAIHIRATSGVSPMLSAECHSFLLNAMVLQSPTIAPAA